MRPSITLSHNAPATIDQFASQLSTLLGQPVTVSFTNNVLLINLNYNFATTQDVNLGFTLPSARAASPTSTARRRSSLAVNGSVDAGAGHRPQPAVIAAILLQDSSKIRVAALVNASGIAFNATVGPLGVSIVERHRAAR